METPAQATDAVNGDVADPLAVPVMAGDWALETVLLVDAASGLRLLTGTRDWSRYRSGTSARQRQS